MKKCNFLTGKRILTCTGNTRSFVPSLFELEKYCRSTRSEQCPVLNTESDKGQNRVNEQSDCWPSLG